MSFITNLNRRDLLATSSSGLAAGIILANSSREIFAAQPRAESHQATGVKVGEVSDTSAIVWTRLTADPNHNANGVDLGRKTAPLPKGRRIADLRGACPGAAGRIRLRYSTNRDLKNSQNTDWVNVTQRTDYSHQFRLTELQPATVYYYAVETSGPGGNPVHGSRRGQFQTAPAPDDYGDTTFTVVTGQAYKDLDHQDGFNIYPSMGRLNPQFIVPTGDTVYYDNDNPLVNSVELARHHWHRMYGLPRHIEFHQRVAGYWEKDDHDCYYNDCWPGQRRKRVLPFTFNQGLELFREQVPMRRLTYRTYRWGRGLQIWLVEGRDYRSPNTMPDGPNKTIWGETQKRWLKQTMQASNAVFKVLISPTPIVGPDRRNKRDNHSNEAFQHEGDEIRQWFQKNLPERFFICCGDRHWQYHSVHPKTRVHEFSCGPASNRHAGGSPGLNRDYHRFHRVQGGFLSVSYNRRGNNNLLFLRLHDVMGKVVYTHQAKG